MRVDASTRMRMRCGTISGQDRDNLLADLDDLEARNGTQARDILDLARQMKEAEEKHTLEMIAIEIKCSKAEIRLDVAVEERGTLRLAMQRMTRADENKIQVLTRERDTALSRLAELDVASSADVAVAKNENNKFQELEARIRLLERACDVRSGRFECSHVIVPGENFCICRKYTSEKSAHHIPAEQAPLCAERLPNAGEIAQECVRMLRWPYGDIERQRHGAGRARALAWVALGKDYGAGGTSEIFNRKNEIIAELEKRFPGVSAL